MIRLSDLIGHRAMDLSTATSSGKVTGVGLAADRIVSFGIGGECIAASAVRGIGGDVVTFDSVAGTQGGPQPVATDPRGARVLDRQGELLGTITDMNITDEGVIDTLELDGRRTLPGSRLQVIGSYAAIVSTETS